MSNIRMKFSLYWFQGSQTIRTCDFILMALMAVCWFLRFQMEFEHLTTDKSWWSDDPKSITKTSPFPAISLLYPHNCFSLFHSFALLNIQKIVILMPIGPIIKVTEVIRTVSRVKLVWIRPDRGLRNPIKFGGHLFGLVFISLGSKVVSFLLDDLFHVRLPHKLTSIDGSSIS